MLLTDDDFLPLLGNCILGHTAGKGLAPAPLPNGIAFDADGDDFEASFLRFEPSEIEVQPFALATSLPGVTLRLQLVSPHAQFANSGYQTTIIYYMLYFMEISTFLGPGG